MNTLFVISSAIPRRPLWPANITRLDRTYWGALGLRVEAGDEIYLDNGTYINLRATFGPVICF